MRIKHSTHICHITNIPISNILIEISRDIEHTTHIGHITHIPTTDILIKCKAFANISLISVHPDTSQLEISVLKLVAKNILAVLIALLTSQFEIL